MWQKLCYVLTSRDLRCQMDGYSLDGLNLGLNAPYFVLKTVPKYNRELWVR